MKRTPLRDSVRAGVFESVREADEVVNELRAAGFREEQISVVCSDEAIELRFRNFEHQDPAGSHTPLAALIGGICGASLAGIAAATLTAFTSLGGVVLLAACGVAIWAGGVVGGIIGSMLTRGMERELADYYDQAVDEGQILVAVQEKKPNHAAHLSQAEEVFARHGVEALPLEAS